MRAHHKLILENLGQDSIGHEKRIRALERGECQAAGDRRSTERVRADVHNLVRAEIAAIGDPGRTCAGCGAPLVRRPNEWPYLFAKRRHCGLSCVQRKGKGVGSRAGDRYNELRWLLEQGVSAAEALPRCGVRSASTAMRWAQRNQDQRLKALLRDAYNAEMRCRESAT